MIDPLSVVGTILAVVQLIGSAASTASQNKFKCLELAERAKTLADVLPSFAHAPAANDTATARVLERLRVAVADALRLIQSCQSAGIFSGKYSSSKAAELDSVDKRINNCILDLTLIGQARTTNAAAAPAQTHVDYSSCYQAQAGGASTAHVAWPPTPQHAWSAPQAYYQQPPGYVQDYYQQPPGYVQGYYPPSPAHSRSVDLSTFYTLPTVNKIFNRVFR